MALSNKDKRKIFVFVDLETTGLNPGSDKIIEVAVIFTDDHFREIDRYTSLCNGLENNPPKINSFVLKMHGETHLLSDLDLAKGTLPSVEEIDANLIAILAKHLLNKETCLFYPAGSSVHFDVSFINENLPRFSSVLSHQHLDLTSVKLFLQAGRKSFVNAVQVIQPKHRALNDILTDLEFARRYARKIKVKGK